MTSNGMMPDLKMVSVDTRKERVHLRCHQCKRIGLEQSRQQLHEKLQQRQTLAAFGFHCQLCGFGNQYMTESIVGWLDEIYRERERSIYDWYDFKRRVIADYRIEGAYPHKIAAASWY